MFERLKYRVEKTRSLENFRFFFFFAGPRYRDNAFRRPEQRDRQLPRVECIVDRVMI